VKVLIIEDTASFRIAIQTMLKNKVDVFSAATPSLGFKILENEAIDIILCDYLLPEMDGLEVLSNVKYKYPDVEVIMMSSSGDMNTVIDALRKGAADFLRKPFNTSDLWVSLERTKKFSVVQADLNLYKKKNKLLSDAVNKETESNLIGKTEKISEIKELMEMVAITPDTSVLLLGESGTGKELIARGIHTLSSRKDELFGAVNMSAIPEPLFESEFFGHKKGSFTGAIADKAGWFESANKGTLFFDEVGEMSLNLQVKLLRVLEDRKFVKVGTHKEQSFDIRIIAATNKTVDDLTSGKDFRIDLYHRLGTFIIQIPALRERVEDIPELSQFFLNILNKKMGKNITSIHKDVYNYLNNYSFPGNIRELKNMIERAIIICTGNELTPKHFSIFNFSNLQNKFAEASQKEVSLDLAEVEKQTILKALEKTDYNKSEAAKLLNIEWNALYRRIKKHQIELPNEV
jgi:DNA-binding NtrC family response regulator